MSFLRDPHKNKWIGNRFAFFAAWLSMLLFMARRRIVSINYKENSDDDMRFCEFYCTMNVFSHAPSSSLNCAMQFIPLYIAQVSKGQLLFFVFVQLCFPSLLYAFQYRFTFLISIELLHEIHNREKQLHGDQAILTVAREKQAQKKGIQLKNK